LVQILEQPSAGFCGKVPWIPGLVEALILGGAIIKWNYFNKSWKVRWRWKQRKKITL